MSRAALFNKARLLALLQASTISVIVPALGSSHALVDLHKISQRDFVYLGERLDAYVKIAVNLGLEYPEATTFEDLEIEEQVWLQFLQACCVQLVWREDDHGPINTVIDTQGLHHFAAGDESDILQSWASPPPATATGAKAARLPDGSIIMRIPVEVNLKQDCAGKKVHLCAQVVAGREPDNAEAQSAPIRMKSTQQSTEKHLRISSREVSVVSPFTLSSTSVYTAGTTFISVSATNDSPARVTIQRIGVLPNTIMLQSTEVPTPVPYDVAPLMDDLPAVIEPGDTRSFVMKANSRSTSTDVGGEIRAAAIVVWRVGGLRGSVVSRVRVKWTTPRGDGIAISVSQPTPLLQGRDGTLTVVVVNNTPVSHTLTLLADESASKTTQLPSWAPPPPPPEDSIVLLDNTVPIGEVASGASAALLLRVRPLKGGSITLTDFCLRCSVHNQVFKPQQPVSVFVDPSSDVVNR